ncbi:MAG: thioredoxin family protein [Vulcanimicrobiota bacterium]
MQKSFRLFLTLLLSLSMAVAALAESETHKKLNAGSEGEVINLKPHLVGGKTNIIDFYSDYCPPCRAVAPYLEKLAAKDPDVVVGKVDINRPGHRGIDWKSPVAEQFGLQSVPHFKVYDGTGKLVAEGDEARQMVIELLEKNKIE